MKRYIAGVITGIAVSCSTALAVNYIATDNEFPVQLNGDNIELKGYNVDGNTYFKLRDIANKIGGFSVDFQNGIIQLAKDGYVYVNKETLAVTDDMKADFAEYCLRIPDFTEEGVTTQTFADDFIFYFYTGKQTNLSKRTDDLYYAWTSDTVRAQYKELFGCDMPSTSTNYENGYYWVHVSDFGEVKFVLDSTTNAGDGINIQYKIIDPIDNTLCGYTTFHIIPADNDAGYVIVSKISTQN